MNKFLTIIVLLCFLTNCSQDTNRWEAEDIQTLPVNLIDISESYYNTEINNSELIKKFPDFFNNIPDTILSKRRSDELAIEFNNKVKKKIQLSQVKDSLSELFGYIKNYNEKFIPPKVYSFTGEMPYLNPIAYFAQTHDLVIGLDWFLGENEQRYQEIGIPKYLRKGMNFNQFKPAVARNIATQMVPYLIEKRKFIDMMVYEGKIIALTKKFCPMYSEDQLMNFTKEELLWLKENEAEVYLYFTENDLIFNNDHKLSERFIQPAPFSKFYLENDTETPGRVGVWIGWKIVEKYLNENPEVSIQEMLQLDGEEIFKSSGYKPN